jgi:hypothetical protein
VIKDTNGKGTSGDKGTVVSATGEEDRRMTSLDKRLVKVILEAENAGIIDKVNEDHITISERLLLLQRISYKYKQKTRAIPEEIQELISAYTDGHIEEHDLLVSEVSVINAQEDRSKLSRLDILKRIVRRTDSLERMQRASLIANRFYDASLPDIPALNISIPESILRSYNTLYKKTEVSYNKIAGYILLNGSDVQSKVDDVQGRLILKARVLHFERLMQPYGNNDTISDLFSLFPIMKRHDITRQLLKAGYSVEDLEAASKLLDDKELEDRVAWLRDKYKRFVNSAREYIVIEENEKIETIIQNLYSMMYSYPKGSSIGISIGSRINEAENILYAMYGDMWRYRLPQNINDIQERPFSSTLPAKESKTSDSGKSLEKIKPSLTNSVLSGFNLKNTHDANTETGKLQDKVLRVTEESTSLEKNIYEGLGIGKNIQNVEQHEQRQEQEQEKMTSEKDRGFIKLVSILNSHVLNTLRIEEVLSRKEYLDFGYPAEPTLFVDNKDIVIDMNKCVLGTLVGVERRSDNKVVKLFLHEDYYTFKTVDVRPSYFHHVPDVSFYIVKKDGQAKAIVPQNEEQVLWIDSNGVVAFDDKKYMGKEIGREKHFYVIEIDAQWGDLVKGDTIFIPQDQISCYDGVFKFDAEGNLVNTDFKEEFFDATGRTAARKFMDIVRFGCVSLSAQLPYLSKLLPFMEDERGKAVMGFMLGCALPYVTDASFLTQIPVIQKFLKDKETSKKMVESLAQELRVEGLAVAQDELMSTSGKPLAAFLQDQFKQVVQGQDTERVNSGSVPALAAHTSGKPLDTASDDAMLKDNEPSRV